MQWEVKTGKLLRTVDAGDLHTYNGGQGVHYGGVRSIALSPDGKRLACCGLYQATNPLGAVNAPLVLSFDWETLEKKQHVAKDLKGIAWRVLFHPQGGYVIISHEFDCNTSERAIFVETNWFPKRATAIDRECGLNTG